MLKRIFRIVHLTSVHQRYDTRIFIKECQSLVDSGYEVSLVVADGRGGELKDGVDIYDVGKASGRLKRILKTTNNIYQKALELDADIYHLHDPELIPIGLRLLGKEKKVVFDAHEDLPKQILSKPYLKAWQAKSLSWLIKQLEEYALVRFSGVIAATPFIREKFEVINTNTVDINNYPQLSEFAEIEYSERHIQKAVCYVGGLSKVRGIKEIVQAMDYVQSDMVLKIAGGFSELEFEKDVKSQSGWQSVQELGFLDRQGVQDTLLNSLAGLVTLHPVINYQDALPVKMFEYMAAGLPVIASNIKLWQEIIENNVCGICVNPMNPREIAEAIDYIATHPEEAREMGINGKKAVLEKYNWGIEEKKLLSFYRGVIQ